MLSSIRRSLALAAVLVLGGLPPPPAAAGMRFDAIHGHLGLGYARLFADRRNDEGDPLQDPAGSIAIAGGIDYPIGPSLRAGIDVGYNLLGTVTEERGSLIAELDYGVFEALALLHWTPTWKGPLGRVSIGPGLFTARADLSSSGGAGFQDLPVEETVIGGAASITVITRGPSPVRVGFELGARVLLLDDETWTIGTGKLTFHY